MEIAGREFYERVRRGFLAMAEQEPHRMVRIDGMQSIDSIHAEIWKTVRERTASHVS